MDPPAYGEWLTDLRARYGGFSEWLHSFGLLNLANSFVVRLMLVALGLNCAVSISERTSRIWVWREGEGGEDESALGWTEESPAPGAMDRILLLLSGMGWRVEENEERGDLAARRFPLRQTFVICALGGLLLALGGRLWEFRLEIAMASWSRSRLVRR
jgi:hypothetical protein